MILNSLPRALIALTIKIYDITTVSQMSLLLDIALYCNQQIILVGHMHGAHQVTLHAHVLR